jgi:hypothetical protein
MLAGSTGASGTRVEQVPAGAGAVVAAAARVATNAHWLAVAAISSAVALFLLLRLHAWPPHEDETLALFVGRQPLGDLFDTVLSERGGAPLHFLLTHLVALVSPGLTGLRLLSTFFAVTSIPIVAALTFRLTDRRTGVIATLIVAVSWATLFHGIYGRMYSLFLFTTALSFLLLLRALGHGGWKRWFAWSIVMLAALATMPYGAMVLATQAVYVLARRVRRPFSLRAPLLAFVAVTAIATPLWRTYLVLASRFEVGGSGRESNFDSPYEVLVYLRGVVGDFGAGWDAAFAPIVALALLGLIALVRSRPPAALLAASVFVVPTAALLLARLGGAAVPETRHLIFALPFFAMLLAAGLVRAVALTGRSSATVLALALATLVSVEIAWGWQTTPSLYAGEPYKRAEARHAAAAWLAATSRPTDVLFGYNPLFLEAREKGGDLGDIVVPRADVRLAVRTLEEAEKPLGRGVWVHDATNNGITRRYEIPELAPAGEEFEARAFGPFLVIRTTLPEETARAFLRDSLHVQQLGKNLGVSDADINYVTARDALRRIEDGD